MSNQSKSAVLGILILVTLWILIFSYWPSQAPEDPVGEIVVTPAASTEPAVQVLEATDSPPPTHTPQPAPIPTATPTIAPTPELMRSVQHLVQAGETLQSIADQHNTSVGLLAIILRVEELAPGNTITILAPNPAACPSQRVHLIMEGETLYSLAKRYAVTLETLMSVNGLTDPMILAGRMLCIPSQ